MKRVISTITYFGLFFFAGTIHATVLVHDTFEDSLGNWRAQGDAFLYTYKGTGMNYATKGSGAAAIASAYNQGILTLKDDLALDSYQASSVTISFNYEWDETNATRYMCIDYSLDGGRTWSNRLDDVNSWGSFTGIRTLGSFSKTLDEKKVGSFTDNFKFRIRGKDGGKAVTAFIDDIEIIGEDVVPIRTTKDDIPEPSTFALILSLASIAAFRRRRSR